jgi:hypothetical protein
MGTRTVSNLKNTNRTFDNILDSYLNLTDGGTVTGDITHDGGLTRYGNVYNEQSRLGLNPIWAFNFGDPSVVASGTEAGAKATILTPISTLFNLSLALGKAATQTAELTVAESTELLGSTATASTSAAIAAGATNVIMGDDLTVTRVTGGITGNLVLTASTIDYQANESFLMIFSGGNTFTHGHALTLTTHADAELNAEGSEIITSGAGTNKMSLITAPSDADNTIVLTATGTASGVTTLLPGSYIYGIAEGNTDILSIKMCLRTSGGTLAPTFA